MNKKCFCIDCGVLLGKQAYTHKTKRCRSCSTKKQLSISKNHPMYGKNHSLKTRKIMSKIKKELLKNPKNNPAYKDGRSIKNYYCSDCGIKLKCYKSKRCFRCAAIYRLLNNKSKIKFQDTDIELKVKEELQKRKIKFIHPYKIPKYPHMADYYIPKYNLIIECDGLYWHQLPKHIKKDKINNYTMRNKGYRVKRLKGKNILKNKVNYNKLLKEETCQTIQ